MDGSEPTWGKNIPGRGSCKSKGSEVEMFQHVWEQRAARGPGTECEQGGRVGCVLEEQPGPDPWGLFCA